jgi:hypothetical protein
MNPLKILKYIGFGILGIGFVALAIYLVMLLWNALIPELFAGPVLGYWQTAGLFLLAKILLTGVSSCGNGHSRRDWKKYREKYRHYHGHYHPGDSNEVNPENV